MTMKKNDISQDKERHHRAYIGVRQWLDSLYRKNLAWSDQGVVRVNEAVAKRFSLGKYKDPTSLDEDIFIAMRQEEMAWAADMPWEYAAVYRGKKDLYLVASSIEVDGAVTPPFGLSFQLPSVGDASMLTTYGKLQLRRFAIGSEHYDSVLVTRASFSEMPVHLLDENDTVFDVGVKPKSRLDSKSSRG